jgi:hypothetical protein
VLGPSPSLVLTASGLFCPYLSSAEFFAKLSLSTVLKRCGIDRLYAAVWERLSWHGTVGDGRVGFQ